MFWHLILAPYIALFYAVFAALPPWTIKIGNGGGDGSGDGGSSDNSFIHYALQSMAGFDKFLPLHDGVLPLVFIASAMFIGLSGFKLFKFLLSLIPTISAGG